MYIILLGISKYDNISTNNLTGVPKDLKNMKQLFKDYFGYKYVFEYLGNNIFTFYFFYRFQNKNCDFFFCTFVFFEQKKLKDAQNDAKKKLKDAQKY